jgi:hypothetical protein
MVIVFPKNIKVNGDLIVNSECGIRAYFEARQRLQDRIMCCMAKRKAAQEELDEAIRQMKINEEWKDYDARELVS